MVRGPRLTALGPHSLHPFFSGFDGRVSLRRQTSESRRLRMSWKHAAQPETGDALHRVER